MLPVCALYLKAAVVLTAGSSYGVRVVAYENL